MRIAIDWKKVWLTSKKNIANLELVYYVNMVVDAITIITKTAAHAAFANANKNENQGHNRDMPDYGTPLTPSCKTHGSLSHRQSNSSSYASPPTQLPFTTSIHMQFSQNLFQAPFFLKCFYFHARREHRETKRTKRHSFVPWRANSFFKQSVMEKYLEFF